MATYQTATVSVSGTAGNSITVSVVSDANTAVTGIDAAGNVVG
jgi:hypothetical protein